MDDNSDVDDDILNDILNDEPVKKKKTSFLDPPIVTEPKERFCTI